LSRDPVDREGDDEGEIDVKDDGGGRSDAGELSFMMLSST
jgi:hypothetical protein